LKDLQFLPKMVRKEGGSPLQSSSEIQITPSLSMQQKAMGSMSPKKIVDDLQKIQGSDGSIQVMDYDMVLRFCIVMLVLKS